MCCISSDWHASQSKMWLISKPVLYIVTMTIGKIVALWQRIAKMLSQFAVLTTRMQDFWKRAMYLNLLSTRTVNSQIYVRHLNIQIQMSVIHFPYCPLDILLCTVMYTIPMVTLHIESDILVTLGLWHNIRVVTKIIHLFSRNFEKKFCDDRKNHISFLENQSLTKFGGKYFCFNSIEKSELKMRDRVWKIGRN